MLSTLPWKSAAPVLRVCGAKSLHLHDSHARWLVPLTRCLWGSIFPKPWHAVHAASQWLCTIGLLCLLGHMWLQSFLGTCTFKRMLCDCCMLQNNHTPTQDTRHTHHVFPCPLLQVCGLKWSPDDREVASGGNDNQLYIWNLNSLSPITKFSDHNAAVKAIAWSPHQHGLLASGGGTADRCIRFWNSATNTALNCIDTGIHWCGCMRHTVLGCAMQYSCMCLSCAVLCCGVTPAD